MAGTLVETSAFVDRVPTPMIVVASTAARIIVRNAVFGRMAQDLGSEVLNTSNALERT